jgi:hypothetical protein
MAVVNEEKIKIVQAEKRTKFRLDDGLLTNQCNITLSPPPLLELWLFLNNMKYIQVFILKTIVYATNLGYVPQKNITLILYIYWKYTYKLFQLYTLLDSRLRGSDIWCNINNLCVIPAKAGVNHQLLCKLIIKVFLCGN